MWLEKLWPTQSSNFESIVNQYTILQGGEKTRSKEKAGKNTISRISEMVVTGMHSGSTAPIDNCTPRVQIIWDNILVRKFLCLYLAKPIGINGICKDITHESIHTGEVRGSCHQSLAVRVTVSPCLKLSDATPLETGPRCSLMGWIPLNKAPQPGKRAHATRRRLVTSSGLAPCTARAWDHANYASTSCPRQNGQSSPKCWQYKRRVAPSKESRPHQGSHMSATGEKKRATRWRLATRVGRATTQLISLNTDKT